MTSSYSKNSVFTRLQVNKKPAYSEISTLKSVFEKMRFGDRFHVIGVNDRPNWTEKISVFKQKRIRVDEALVKRHCC